MTAGLQWLKSCPAQFMTRPSQLIFPTLDYCEWHSGPSQEDRKPLSGQKLNEHQRHFFFIFQQQTPALGVCSEKDREMPSQLHQYGSLQGINFAKSASASLASALMAKLCPLSIRESLNLVDSPLPGGWKPGNLVVSLTNSSWDSNFA